MPNQPAEFFRSAIRWFVGIRAVDRVRLALALLAIVLLADLIFATKPWQVTVTDAKSMRIDDYVKIWTWYASLINLGIVGLLGLTAGWWTGQMPRATESSPKSPRYFWWLVGGAVVFTAIFATPRLNDSLWDDEDFNVSHSIFGRFDLVEKTGKVRFKKVPWEDTFYDYREPNNHVLHSVLARTSLTLWRAVVRPDGFPFAEWPIRLPAFLFGLGAVVSLAWFVKEFFGPRAGVLAAWLLAMHPWFIRYASEARGYSMALCLLPLLFVFWRRCLNRGEWRWWLAYGAVQWAALYAYPGVFTEIALLNLLALPLMFWSDRPFSAQLGRWFAVHCFSAMAVLQLMLPLIPQAKLYFDYETSRHIVLGWPWIQSTLAFLAVGAPWAGETPEHPSLTGLIAPDSPWFAVTVGILAGLTLIGFLRFLTHSRLSAALAIAIVLAPVITFGISVSRHHLIYACYVIYLLPGLIAFVATGLTGLATLSGKLPGGRVWTAALPGVALVGFFLLTAPVRNWLAIHPLQPTRDSVVLSRGTLDPWADSQKNILTASYCIPPRLYDGNLIQPRSAGDLIELMQRADRDQQTLVLNIGMPWAAKAFSPQMWKLSHHPALFTGHQRLRGFDSGLDRIVTYYIPGSAATFDFSSYDPAAR